MEVLKNGEKEKDKEENSQEKSEKKEKISPLFINRQGRQCLLIDGLFILLNNRMLLMVDVETQSY